MASITTYDFFILDFIHTHLQSGIGDVIMPYITLLGNGGIFWILLTLFFLISKKWRRTGLALSIALTLSLLIGNLLLKPLVARIRPCDINTSITLLISRPHDFSFPSGHTMSSFAVALSLFFSNSKMGISALILAALISFSRLYLYVHFPTDVIAGAIIGSINALLAVRFSSLTLQRRL